MTELKRGPFTYEDYLLFPEDGKRYEIIEGDRFVTPAPVPAHQRVSRNLEFILESFTRKTGAGEVFHAPVDVVLSDTDVVQPDLLIVGKDQADIVGEKNISGAPYLVAEILSEGTRKMDFLIKRKLYERFGVREYWIVDPEIKRIEVFVNRKGRLEKTGEYSPGETFESAAFPGLSVPVDEVFRGM